MNRANAEIYDAIVVGLGPGGSTAALDLSRKGLSVLALDQARFPRSKPCGGCLSLKIDRILEHDFHAVVERVIHGVTVKFRNGRALHVRTEQPVAYMVMRDRFDAFLVQKARKAGVHVQEAERVTHVTEEDDQVEVRTATGAYRGRFLIGADGINGVVGRSLGLYRRRRKAVLIEGEIGIQEVIAHGLEDEVLLEFGHVPYGYGWIFPKWDHLSIGIGGIGAVTSHPKAAYQEFVGRYDIFHDTDEGRQYGYSLPLWTKKQRLTTRRALLIGDAAGLVDPFIGEGIYYAVRSGELAAEAIALARSAPTPDLTEYQRMVAREISPEFAAARSIGRFVYSFPGLFQLRVERNAELFSVYFDVLRGNGGYRRLRQEAIRGLKADLLRFARRRSSSDASEAAPHAASEPSRDGVNLWNTFLGRGAWAHLEHLVAAVVKPGAVVLDAGTGTGVAAQMVLQKSRPARVIGIDRSIQVLSAARQSPADPRVSFHAGDITALPYRDGTFDLVISAWALDRLRDPRAAVAEFLRVIKEDGYVVYLYATLPERGSGRLLASIISRALSRHGDRQFVAKEEQAYHNCPRSSLARFTKGLITVVVLRKCCVVRDEIMPTRGINHQAMINEQKMMKGRGSK